ncbi:MAG: hypothetical protein EBU88_19280 [Acidobacteria bacterium]|nr:hypothetical protein [Acidobacteriota bacterium]
MIKKVDEVVESQPLIAVADVVEPEARSEGAPPPVERQAGGRNINLIIHGWLTDVWLLSTGEDLSAETVGVRGSSHGRPLALASDGQIRLLGSRSITLDAMRDVGIEMS